MVSGFSCRDADDSSLSLRINIHRKRLALRRDEFRSSARLHDFQQPISAAVPNHVHHCDKPDIAPDLGKHGRPDVSLGKLCRPEHWDPVGKNIMANGTSFTFATNQISSQQFFRVYRVQ